MIDNFKHIEGLFKEVDAALSKKVSIFVIGGAVLLQQGLKPATKDIDLIVESKEEFLELQKALDKLNFAPTIPGNEYKHMNLNQIFQRGDFRIDIFQKEVCGRFSLSESMKKRANTVLTLDHSSVALCANEDIFLFKTMTEREGDITDCISLGTTELDWNAMLEELKGQIQQSKRDVWITWVGERLDILQDRGLVIPIMEDINTLREKFFESLEGKKEGFI